MYVEIFVTTPFPQKLGCCVKQKQKQTNKKATITNQTVHQREFYKVFLSPCSAVFYTTVLNKVINFMHPCLWTAQLLEVTRWHPVMILSPVTSEPVHLWNFPNRWFWSGPQLSRSFAAPVPTCLKHVVGLKFRISMYLQNSIKLMRWNIRYIV